MVGLNELYRYYNVGGEWAETEASVFIANLMNEIDRMECQDEISATNFIPIGKENEKKFADLYWLKTK
jgi:hypothetical protein